MKSSLITTLAFANKYNQQVDTVTTVPTVATVATVATMPTVAVAKKRGRKPGSKKILTSDNGIKIIQTDVTIDFN